MIRSASLAGQFANSFAQFKYLPTTAALFLGLQTRLFSSIDSSKEFHLIRQFTAEDVAAFLALTGDANAIHTDPSAAIAAGLSSPILPGILMASLFPAIIGTNFPGSIYLSQTLKFRQSAEVQETVFSNISCPSPL